MKKVIHVCEKCGDMIETRMGKGFREVTRLVDIIPKIKITWCECGNSGVMTFREERISGRVMR